MNEIKLHLMKKGNKDYQIECFVISQEYLWKLLSFKDPFFLDK